MLYQSTGSYTVLICCCVLLYYDVDEVVSTNCMPLMLMDYQSSISYLVLLLPIIQPQVTQVAYQQLFQWTLPHGCSDLAHCFHCLQRYNQNYTLTQSLHHIKLCTYYPCSLCSISRTLSMLLEWPGHCFSRKHNEMHRRPCHREGGQYIRLANLLVVSLPPHAMNYATTHD